VFELAIGPGLKFGMMRAASAFPSSTPTGQMSQCPKMAPCVKTLCSYNATSFPSASGVSRSIRIVLDGRLPSKVWCASAIPVCPQPLPLRRFAKASASAWANTLAQEQVVVASERVKRLNKPDEVAWDELGPLMNQLVEGMLSIGARLPPIDRPGLADDLSPIKHDVLAIALHRQLLEVSREALQVLFIRKNRHGLRAERNYCTRVPGDP